MILTLDISLNRISIIYLLFLLNGLMTNEDNSASVEYSNKSPTINYKIINLHANPPVKLKNNLKISIVLLYKC